MRLRLVGRNDMERGKKHFVQKEITGQARNDIFWQSLQKEIMNQARNDRMRKKEGK